MQLRLATHPVMLRWEIVGNHLSNQSLFDFVSRDSRSKKQNTLSINGRFISQHEKLNKADDKKFIFL